MSALYGNGDFGSGTFGEGTTVLTANLIMNARKAGSGDSARATALLPLVPLYLSPTVFTGDLWLLVQALLVLHWMQLEDNAGGNANVGGQIGPVESESEGQLSRSYGSAAETGAFGLKYLTSTMWGNELRAVIRANTPTFGIANGGIDTVPSIPSFPY